MRLRRTPEVRFLNDDSFARGERVLRLLEMADRERTGEPLAPRASAVVDDEEGFFVLGDDSEDDEDGDAAPEEAAARVDSADDASSRFAAKAARPKAAGNRFLEGLEDDSEDDDEEEGERRFFSADMFPDAQPALEELEARKKAMLWAAQNSKKGGKGKIKRPRAAQP